MAGGHRLYECRPHLVVRGIAGRVGAQGSAWRGHMHLSFYKNVNELFAMRTILKLLQ